MAARARRGVTFLEIMVVMTIFAVMMAFVAPAMRGPHERNKLRAGCREIVSLMRYARASAILHSAHVGLEIDLPNDRYRLDLSRIEDGRAPAPRTDKRRREVETWRPLPDKIEFLAVFSWDDPDPKSGVSRILFFSDGSASDSRIVLQNQRARYMTVSISRATADARIHDGIPEDWDEVFPEARDPRRADGRRAAAPAITGRGGS